MRKRRKKRRIQDVCHSRDSVVVISSPALRPSSLGTKKKAELIIRQLRNLRVAFSKVLAFKQTDPLRAETNRRTHPFGVVTLVSVTGSSPTPATQLQIEQTFPISMFMYSLLLTTNEKASSRSLSLARRVAKKTDLTNLVSVVDQLLCLSTCFTRSQTTIRFAFSPISFY